MRNLLLILPFFLFACRDFREVQVSGIKGFKVNKISTEGINGDLQLTLRNPNNFSFTLYKSGFDVRYSGIYLGKALLAKKVKIKANAEETYSFNLQSDFKNVTLLEVLKLLNGASFKNSLEVKGDLMAGKFYLKKKIPVDLKEKLSLQ
jgi:LEA14-like dessication related protein